MNKAPIVGFIRYSCHASFTRDDYSSLVSVLEMSEKELYNTSLINLKKVLEIQCG